MGYVSAIDRRQAVALYATGYYKRHQLALAYGVSDQTVSRWWRHRADMGLDDVALGVHTCGDLDCELRRVGVAEPVHPHIVDRIDFRWDCEGEA